MTVKSDLMRSLTTLSIASGNEQNGLDFYKFFFENFPDLRTYFRGAENYTASDVQKSERFSKQGQRLLLSIHIIAAAADDPELIKAYAREMVTKHRPFRMDPQLWAAFWDVWNAFLENRGVATPDIKTAWKSVGKIFGDEAIRYGKLIGA